jgi:hypothetical protein
MRMDHSDKTRGKGGNDARGAGTGAALFSGAARNRIEPARADGTGRSRNLGIPASILLGLAGLGVGAVAARFALPGDAPRTRGEASISSVMAAASMPEVSKSSAQLVTDALGRLKVEAAELRAAVADDQEKIGSSDVTKKLDAVTSRLEEASADPKETLAKLASRFAPLGRETAARLGALAERLERRSEPSAEAKPAQPKAKASAAPTPTEASKSSPVLDSWVLRQVYDGVALVEGAEGAREVVPGELLPGAGLVRSIEQKDKGWIVVTSRGVIDSDRHRY